MRQNGIAKASWITQNGGIINSWARTLKSFFGSIQNWFQGDFYGRHLGLILQEIGRRHPKPLAAFLASQCTIPASSLKDARFEAEYIFRGRSGYRRADLAVFSGDTDTPVVLVEIKYHDKPLPETATKPAQLDDYREWSRREGGHVLLLSREAYAATDLTCRRWNALARHLRSYVGESDLIAMLVQFLEEEGNVMQEIKPNSLIKYIKRFLCNHEQGANNIDGPVEFANLLKNLRLMSGTFDLYFKDAWKSAGTKVEGIEYDKRSRVATIDFQIHNRIKEVKDGTKIVNADGNLLSALRAGGIVDIYAQHSLGHGNDWLRVAYGITFDVSPGDNEENPPLTHLYAWLNSRELERTGMPISVRKKVNFSWVTDNAEQRAEKVEQIFGKLICEVIGQAQGAKLPLIPQQKNALKTLCKELSALRPPPADEA
jgi:hypothetical protein